MYLLPTALTLAVMLSMAAGNLELRPAGWLDKLVKYHREKLLKDVRKEAPMNVKATLKPRPEGYVDSPLWNLTSVIHLMTLIRYSEGTSDVRKALRRMMGPGPTRRFLSVPKTYKYFPSLAKDAPNYFYYNMFSEEMYFEDTMRPEKLDENAVLFISNPVESRLPSAQISVNLLNSWKTATTSQTPNATSVSEDADTTDDSNQTTDAANTDSGDQTTEKSEDPTNGSRLKLKGKATTTKATTAAPTNAATATPQPTTTPPPPTTTTPPPTTTTPPPTTTTPPPTTTTPPPTTTRKRGKQDHLNEQF